MGDIREVEFRPPPVDAELVSFLEDLLERVRAGGIEHVAVAIMRRDGVAESYASATSNYFEQIGLIQTMLKNVETRDIRQAISMLGVDV